MEEKLLLTYQKNDVLKSIQGAGLTPLDFEWKRAQSTGLSQTTVSKLLYKHKGGDYYFKFDWANTDDFNPFLVRISEFSPGREDSKETRGVGDWESQRETVAEWLQYPKREVDTPDLWEQLSDYAPREKFIDAGAMSNAPFSDSEAEKVVESLKRLQKEIEKNFSLQEDQLAFVTRQIEYLKDGAKRQGKRDWLHTSIGVVATVAMGLALSPERTKLLWELVKSCFSGLLQLPAP
jgi:hypothetical protein